MKKVIPTLTILCLAAAVMAFAQSKAPNAPADKQAAATAPASPSPQPVLLTHAERAKQEEILARLEQLRNDQDKLVIELVKGHSIDVSKYRYDIGMMVFVPNSAPPVAPPSGKPGSAPAPSPPSAAPIKK